MGPGDHALDGFIDAGVQAQGQAVAGGIDLVEQLRQGFAAVAQHVQHRAEDLTLKFAEAVQFDHGGRHKMAVPRVVQPAPAQRLLHPAPLGTQGIDVAQQAGPGFGIDHRAHVGVQLIGAAQAQLGHGAGQHLQHAVGGLFLHAQHAQGRAALAGTVEGRGQHVGDHLLDQGGRVHDHRVLTTGLCDQRYRATAGAQAAGQLALQQARHLGGAREHHPLHPLVGHQGRPHGFTAAGQQLQHGVGHAGLAQQTHGLRGQQGGLLGRLGQHRVAGGQGGGHLAGEDGQRKVPGADADHRAQRAMRQIGQITARLGGVIAQKVDRLAHLGHGVGAGLARLTHQQAHQHTQLLLHQVGSLLQGLGSLCRGRGGPGGCGLGGRLHRPFDAGQGGFLHPADGVAQIRRVEHRLGRFGPLGLGLRPGQQGLGLPFGVGAAQQLDVQGLQGGVTRQVHALGVAAGHAIQIGRRGDRRVGQAQRAFAQRHLLDGLHRVLHQFIQRQAGVGDAVHERGVGAVFQQAAHQVGEQGFMVAHGRIDAAGPVQAAGRLRAHHLLVQGFTHAVQALELVLTGLVAGRVGQLVDGGQGVGIVGGELGVDGLGRGQQAACAGQVGHIGVGLAGVNRVVAQAIELGTLDFAVPVGALDQAHHQAVAAAPGQVDHVVDHVRAAFLVGLDHEADAVPARQRGLEAQALQQLQRQLQAVGFFGVDVQADVVATRLQRQLSQHGVQLGMHPVVLGPAVTRVQRRQLDRDAGAFIHAAPG